MQYISASLIVCLLIAIVGCGDSRAQALTRSLHYDEMEVFSIVDFETPGSTSFELSIDSIPKGGDKWAPYIYYALQQGSAENSFRLFLIRNEPDEGLIAGAEFYKNGESVFRNALITEVPLKGKVKFSLSWTKEGIFKYSVMGGAEQTLESGFSHFNAIIHMSNATASFYP